MQRPSFDEYPPVLLPLIPALSEVNRLRYRIDCYVLLIISTTTVSSLILTCELAHRCTLSFVTSRNQYMFNVFNERSSRGGAFQGEFSALRRPQGDSYQASICRRGKCF